MGWTMGLVALCGVDSVEPESSHAPPEHGILFFKSRISNDIKKEETSVWMSLFMGWTMGLEPTIFRATI